MKKIQIACFCETWASGGIESFLSSMILHMNHEDITLDIIAANMEKSIFTAPLQEAGVHFYELSGYSSHMLKNIRCFRQILQQNHYDILHIHAFQGLSSYYAKIAQQCGVPCRILHSHNTALRKSKLRLMKSAVHTSAKKHFSQYADIFWACSEDAAHFLFPEELLQKKGFRWIPNGIELKKFSFQPEIRQQIRRQLGWDDNLIIGHVGRLCYQKNQLFLLDIFKEIYRKNPCSRLLLAGEGEYRELLQKKISALHLEHVVLLYGVSDHIEHLLWAMDAFVFPSLFEGLGIAVIEAQAAGLPVVCSDQIPHEAMVSPSVLPLPLTYCALDWAEAVLHQYDACHNRFESMEKLRQAGFDVQDAANLLHEQYIVHANLTVLE